MDNTINPIIFYKGIIDYSKFVPLIYENIIENIYLINAYGDVFSIIKNRIMKPFINKSGYKRICLLTTTGKRNFSIHRLVASTFIINDFPDSYTDVNHMDGDKFNNKYDNLEYCNNNQNKHHASIMGLYEHGDNRYNAVYTDDFAREICERFQRGESYRDVYTHYQIIYPNTSNTIGSFIYKLYHRKTRSHITKDYKY